MRALFIWLIVSYAMMAVILLLYWGAGAYHLGDGFAKKYKPWLKQCLIVGFLVLSPIFAPWWIVEFVKANIKGGSNVKGKR